jgi:uncharacterized membrane protein YecN with MAPEG domain
MNTVELMVVLIPALWLAAAYWTPEWMSGLGVVYIVGRFIYFKTYINPQAKRTLGYALSYIPTLLLLLAALVGAVLSLFN